MTKNNNNTTNNKTTPPTDAIGSIYAVLLMRIWLGIRSLQAGIEKFAGTKTVSTPVIVDGKVDPNGLTIETTSKTYGFDNYQGVPTALKEPLGNEPLILEPMLNLYNAVLGPLLVLFGILVLAGIATRISLLGMGLLYTSLTFGLILLNQSSGVAWLASHVIMVVLMLLFAHRNRFELGNLLAQRRQR